MEESGWEKARKIGKKLENEAVGYARMCNNNMGENNLYFWSVQILRKMLELCQKNNVEVCLTTLPLNRLILEKLKPNTIVALDSTLEGLSNEFHAPYLNYLQEKLDDDCFININHLNYKGGQIITKKLKYTIEQRDAYP